MAKFGSSSQCFLLAACLALKVSDAQCVSICLRMMIREKTGSRLCFPQLGYAIVFRPLMIKCKNTLRDVEYTGLGLMPVYNFSAALPVPAIKVEKRSERGVGYGGPEDSSPTQRLGGGRPCFGESILWRGTPISNSRRAYESAKPEYASE